MISISISDILNDNNKLEKVYQKKKEYAYFDRILCIFMNYFKNNKPFSVDIYNDINIQFCLILLSIRPEYDFLYFDCIKEEDEIDSIKFFENIMKVFNNIYEKDKHDILDKNKDVIIKLIHLVDISLPHINDEGFIQLSKQKVVYICIYILC